MKKSKEMNKKKLEAQVAENLALLNQKENFENLIKDNKIIFGINKEKYRVRKPTQDESLALQKTRNKKFLELLRDDSYILKEQLLEIYKKKGIDIEEMELKIKDLGFAVEDLEEKLDNTVDKDMIENLEQEIKEIYNKQSKLAVRIADLLEPCIENALVEFANLYIVYSVLEKEIEDKSIDVKEGDNYPKKWIKAFETYEKFLESDNEELILEATANLSLIVYKNKL